MDSNINQNEVQTTNSVRNEPTVETPVVDVYDNKDESIARNSQLALNIPTGDDFKSSRNEYIDRQKKDEEKRRTMIKAELSKAQINMIEEAFKNREPSAPDVRVIIDGEDTVFNKDVELAVLGREYNIEYFLDRNHPRKTVAYIKPSHNKANSNEPNGINHIKKDRVGLWGPRGAVGAYGENCVDQGKFGWECQPIFGNSTILSFLVGVADEKYGELKTHCKR